MQFVAVRACSPSRRATDQCRVCVKYGSKWCLHSSSLLRRAHMYALSVVHLAACMRRLPDSASKAVALSLALLPSRPQMCSFCWLINAALHSPWGH